MGENDAKACRGNVGVKFLHAFTCAYHMDGMKRQRKAAAAPGRGGDGPEMVTADGAGENGVKFAK